MLFKDEARGVSYAKFCQIFNENFKNVSIPKVQSCFLNFHALMLQVEHGLYNGYHLQCI